MTSGPFLLGVPLEPYYEGQGVTLFHGDCIEVLRQLPDCSVDSVVTDPPYGLEFMGKDWDSFAPSVEQPTRSGWDKPTSGAKISDNAGAHGKVAFHRRRHTYRCDGCGRRDAFRNPHDCPGTFQHEWTDPVPVASLTFQAWCQEWAKEALRVLKPGGHLLAFGGTRTWHRLAVAIEDAGFEIRDSIAWMYGSGFPKSLDVSKAIDKAAGAERPVVGSRKLTGTARIIGGQGGATSGRAAEMYETHATRNELELTAPATPDAATWQGWGTALKPAHEPIVVARKPLTGTVAANVLEHGTGALNIDGCRIGFASEADESESKTKNRHADFGTPSGGNAVYGDFSMVPRANYDPPGRWPANVVLDEDQAAALDQQSGTLTRGRFPAKLSGSSIFGLDGHEQDERNMGDSGGASRFFYVAKAPARERPKVDGIAHPTVKPLTLMRWLCRLVTPPGGIVLEPFAGSGTTVQAALAEGFRCIAVEREDDYLPLILSRLTSQEPDDGQLTLDASA